MKIRSFACAQALKQARDWGRRAAILMEGGEASMSTIRFDWPYSAERAASCVGAFFWRRGGSVCVVAPEDGVPQLMDARTFGEIYVPEYLCPPAVRERRFADMPSFARWRAGR